MGIAEDITRLEVELRELVIKYEQYFFGIEKREPIRLLEEVERLAKRYQNVSITNTRQRFKYDALIASLCVHKQKWNRINRLIEEGKYQRDRFRMALHSAEAKGTHQEQEHQHQEHQAAEAAPATEEIDRIYHELLTARQRCNLPTDSVSREKIASAVQTQKPALMKKYRCRDVDFVVVIEEGTPRLKARPKMS